MGRAEEALAGLTEDDFDYGAISPVPLPLPGRGGPRGRRAAGLGRRLPPAGGQRPGGRARRWRTAPRRSSWPARARVSLELTKADDDDALRDALRSGAALAFDAAFTHPEGHALDLALPRLYAASAEDRAAPGAVAEAATRLEAATDAGGDDITWSVDLNP